MTAPRSSSIRRHALWFTAGVAVALFQMWAQASAVGGWTGLLSVGEESALRPVIARLIPNLVILDGEGNDGQIYYAVGLDPTGRQLSDLVPDPGLRWRRILHPVISSGFGTIEGKGLFWSMAGTSAAGLGVASLAMRDMLWSLRLSPWAMLGLLAHPGVWLTVKIVTPDAFGLAFGLGAIALALRGRYAWSVAALTCAALSKEPFLVFAAALAAWLWCERRRIIALTAFIVPLLALIAWSAVVDQLIGGGFFVSGNAAWPFMGIIEASRWWPSFSIEQNRQTMMSLVILAVGVLVGFRSKIPVVSWNLWAWISLALITSEWVWRFGNGNLRAFAPIGIFGAMAIAQIVQDRSGLRTAP